MMRMGKRSTAPDADADDPDTTAESANRIYRMLLNKRQTASMMRMGKRSGRSAFNGDMMRMGKRDLAFNDDLRFGKREYSSFNGDMMRMGKRYLTYNDEPRFGKRDIEMTRNGRDPWIIMDDEFDSLHKRVDNGQMWKKNLDRDLMRIGKKSAFNDDMMRMGKRDWMDKRFTLMSDNMRYGK